MFRHRIGAPFWLSIVLLVCPPAAGGQAPQDGATILVGRLEQAAASANRAAILALRDPAVSRASFEDFAYTLTTPTPARLVLNERDRAPMEGGGHRLIIEVFTEHGIEGRLGTWRVDVRPGATTGAPWGITGVARLSVISGLYRLSLNPAKQYDIHNLMVRAPDLAIEMASGRAFVAETGEGASALVLLGRGRMRFSPADPAERTQVKIFSGDDTLEADIDMAFLRLNPGEFASRVNAGSLTPRAVVPADLRAATTVFNAHVGRALQVDLSDISPDRWSLLPSPGDFIGELRTRKFGTLTYTRSRGEAEDITLFDRQQRRNIAVYASAEKLSERGRFYSESDGAGYDVLSYEVDSEFDPDRGTINGNATLRLRMLGQGSSSLSLRLADSATVRGVFAPGFGRLLHLRVLGQNSVIVNFPAFVLPGTEVLLNVVYRGPIAPQVLDREAIQIAQEMHEPVYVPVEQRWLYSNRSYWYPQASVGDYATGKLRITVPAEFIAVGSGDPVAPVAGVLDAARRRRSFVFEASRPARYFAVVISRMGPVTTSRVNPGGSDVALHVRSNPRQGGRVRDMGEKAAAVFNFYASILGDAPYPSFTLAMIESDRPGGHSPPYFAVLNQVVVGSNFSWRNDPVSFEGFPTFFLAHEVAHQWWGHAVGWKNYHEQWISEGFAQYFAALYAEKNFDAGVLSSLLRQMRSTAIAASEQGPVYLGYRLGHIQRDERVFRSVIYNKAAMVLHMLRRLVGDDAFFRGMRAFYTEWKFKKAGTDDFRQSMERASGRDLHQFFDTWIYGTAIPRVKFAAPVTAGAAALRFEQRGDPVDVAVTVNVQYTSGRSEEVVVLLEDKVTERTLPLAGPVRSITANADNAALVIIER